MKTYATVTSERASKGQGGEYVEISLKGAHSTEIASLRFSTDGSGYRLSGWTHDNHRIDFSISENTEKGERQKGELCNVCDNELLNGRCRLNCR